MDLNKLQYNSSKKEKSTENKGSGDIAEVDHNLWKTLGIVFVTTLFAFLFSYLVKDYFFEVRKLSWSSLQYSVFISTLALLFSVTFYLQTLFIKTFSRLNWMVFLNVAALGLPFYSKMTPEVLGAMAVVYGIALFGAYMGWHELRLLLRIKFFRVGTRVVPKVMTMLALFISLVFYLNIQEGRTNLLTKDLLNSVFLKPSETLISNFVPEFSFDKSGEEVVADIARARIDSDPQSSQLSDAQRESIIARSVEGTKGKIEEIVKRQVSFEKDLSSSIYDLIIDFLIRGSEESKEITALAIAILTFLILKTAGFIFSYAVLIVSFILYEILIALNFATVVLESRTREMIVLK